MHKEAEKSIRNGIRPELIEGSRGFTLIELLIVVVVLAIVATVAVPNFQLLIQNNRVNTSADQFRSSLNTARSEAITRSTPVTVSALDDGFESGWCIHEGDQNSACNDGSRIRQFEPLSGVQVTASDAEITFDRRGRMTFPDDFSFAIEPPDCAGGAERAQQIQVNMSGRARQQSEGCS